MSSFIISKQCMLQRVRFFLKNLLYFSARRYHHASWFHSVFVSSCVVPLNASSCNCAKELKKKKKIGTKLHSGSYCIWMRIQWLWMSIIHANNSNNYLFNIHESIEKKRPTLTTMNNRSRYRKTETKGETRSLSFFIKFWKILLMKHHRPTPHTHSLSGVFVSVLLFYLLFILLALICHADFPIEKGAII